MPPRGKGQPAPKRRKPGASQAADDITPEDEPKDQQGLAFWAMYKSKLVDSAGSEVASQPDTSSDQLMTDVHSFHETAAHGQSASSHAAPANRLQESATAACSTDAPATSATISHAAPAACSLDASASVLATSLPESADSIHAMPAACKLDATGHGIVPALTTVVAEVSLPEVSSSQASPGPSTTWSTKLIRFWRTCRKTNLLTS